MSKKTARMHTMIKVDENLYFDKTEIDVGSWLSYYTWTLENKGIDFAKKTLPDSTAVEPEIWKYITTPSEEPRKGLGLYTLLPFGNFYEKCGDFIQYDKRLNSIPEFCPFSFFPITGLTYEQVVAFCEWRTDVVGENIDQYRLPTEQEWKKLALFALNENERLKGFRDSLLKPQEQAFNYKISKPFINYFGEYKDSKQIGIGFSIGANGLMDVFGNVSEMTSIKGISKGGNFYTTYANQCHIDSIQKYNKPERWLGIRCVVTKNQNRNKKTSTINSNVQITNIENKDTTGTVNWNGKFGTFMDNRDKKTYRCVKIGNQVWMEQNLAYKPLEGKYWAYKNDEEYVPRYGYLYNWETSKTVCPKGWHLPTNKDFEILVQNESSNGKNPYKELTISGSSGFNAISTGLRMKLSFTPIDGSTAFWGVNEKDFKSAYILAIYSYHPAVKIQEAFLKNSGFAVRCIQDN